MFLGEVGDGQPVAAFFFLSILLCGGSGPFFAIEDLRI